MFRKIKSDKNLLKKMSVSDSNPSSPPMTLLVSHTRGKLKQRNVRLQPFDIDLIPRPTSAASGYSGSRNGGSFDSKQNYSSKFIPPSKISSVSRFEPAVITTPNIFYSFQENTTPAFVSDILTQENAISFVTQPPQSLNSPRFLLYTLATVNISTAHVKLVLNGNTLNRRLCDITALDVTHFLVSFGQKNWLVVETDGIIVPFVLLGVWAEFTPIETIIATITSKPMFQFDDISALCPITGQAIDIPAKGANCRHENCFDLFAYITSRQALGVWKCPICGEQVLCADLIAGTHAKINDTSLENIWGINDNPVHVDENETNYIPW